jgi:hypothetical protein
VNLPWQFGSKALAFGDIRFLYVIPAHRLLGDALPLGKAYPNRLKIEVFSDLRM